MKITETELSFLRNELSKYISGKRLSHSLAVEKEAARLSELFGFNENDKARLRVAAILHDITKEQKVDAQIALCKKHVITVTEDDIASPKVFHSVTGAYEARLLYPDYVDEEIFSAIKHHTTGRPMMSLFDKLIYLADYIEETRDFPDCIELRNYFYSKPATMRHLNETLLLSFNMTLKNLIEDGFPIHPSTDKARNYILKELRSC